MASEIVDRELFYGQPCVGKTVVRAPCEKKCILNVHTACKLCHRPDHCRNCHVAGMKQMMIWDDTRRVAVTGDTTHQLELRKTNMKIIAKFKKEIRK